MKGKPGVGILEHNRRVISLFLVLACLVFTLFTSPSWEKDGIIDLTFDWAGYFLVLAGVLGRLWCTLYIGGRKNGELVRSGPYSMCRNPLYFFSFTAGLGVTFVFANIVIIALFIIGFAVYYPAVISSEEKRLEALFGDVFVQYKKTSPAFFIRPSLFSTPETVCFEHKHIVRALGDASIFLLMIPVADIIEKLHESGVLKVLVSLP